MALRSARSSGPCEPYAPSCARYELPPPSAMSSHLRSILAPNPGPMTLSGTRAFVIGRNRARVIGPGAASPDRRAEIERVLDCVEQVSLGVTHCHADHAEAARVLAKKRGAKVWAG